MKKENSLNDSCRIKGALFGFFIGDALGVPVEFINRETLKKRMVTDMEEYGTHNQPKGTWSDDSSMVIATMDSLIKEKRINYYDIMDRFIDWYDNYNYTPFNNVFDIGNATSYALNKYKINRNKYRCGSSEISSNGNGSLMRILPISLYLCYTDDPMYDVINSISSMTHAHIYSVFSCVIYSVFINEFLKCKNSSNAYKNMQKIIRTILEDSNNNNIGNLQDLKRVFNRIIYDDISRYQENGIKSSGYVIDTLEACFWCLLTSNAYSESVLKAVNLGDDTDTIAALTGGLAGLVYGYNNIPEKWVKMLQKETMLRNLVDEFIKLLEERKNMELDDTNSNCTIANKNSWGIKELKMFDKVDCNIKLTKEEMEILRKGYIPKTMEERWFMYCDENTINYFRSWTGFQIFRAYYQFLNDEYIIYRIEINADKTQYNCENILNAVDLFEELIKTICTTK